MTRRRRLVILGGRAWRNPLLFLAPLNGSLSFQDRAGGGTLSGTGAVRYQPADGARTNWWKLGSHEVPSGDYGPAGTATVTRRSDDPDFSGHLLEVSSATAGSGLYHFNNLTIPGLANGVTVTLSFDAKHVSGATDWEIQPQFYSADAALISGPAVLTVPIASATLTRVVVSFVVNVNGVHKLRFVLRRQTATASTVRVDEITAELGTTDGSRFAPDRVWLNPITGMLGAAHDSPSVERAVAWVEEGTTNLLLNPSAEVDATTGTTARAGATITRDTAYAHHDNASFRVVTPNAAVNEGINHRTSTTLGFTGAARTFVGQVRVRGSGTVLVMLQAAYSDSTFLTGAATLVTLTDGWQWITPASITIDAAKTLNSLTVIVHTNVQQGITYWTDSAQIEERALASSYCDGSLGTGYAWTGTAHASSSTRSATVISTTPASSRFNVHSGAYAARFLRDVGTGEQYVMRTGVFGSDDFLVLSVLGANLRLLADTPATPQDTLATAGGVADDIWLFGYGGWSSSQLFAALGTDTPVSMARAAVHGSTSTVLAAGSGSTSVAVFNGLIGPVLITDRPLTTRERRALHVRAVWRWATLRDAA